MLFFDLMMPFMPIILGLMGVLMVVLRAGASRVFFDIVGTFQAGKLISDTGAAMTTMQALAVDGLSGIEDAGSMLAEQMSKVVEATVPLAQELEKAQIQFEKFISEGARLDGSLTQEIQNVGMQFGFTANESLEAGARMAQLSSIMGEGVVPAATEAALAFGLMGDMTPETAMIKLINLQQQTNFAFNGTTKAAYALMTVEQQRAQVTEEMARTLNQLNSVEDHSAATLSKITGVMNEFASQAHLAGESIAMMAAQSATLIEAGEEQGKAGRALRMTYARLGSDTNGAAKALHELGVATTTSDGSLRSLSDIMSDLNPKWVAFNSGQKQALAQQVSGNRHYVRFIKLMEGYDRAMDLNAEAAGMTAAVMTSTGGAVGFLSDMMGSNAIALDKARAELELVNAEIGNVFIPGQIQAAKMQIAWNETILLTIKSLGGLGSGLNKLFGMSKLIQGTFGPFFSAYINIKAASIALLTQKQIMRSLTGQVLAKTSAESKGSAKNKINLTHENLLLAQIDAELEDIIFTNRKKAEEAKSSFVAVKHYLTVERTLTQQTNLAYEGVRGKLAKTNFELIKKNALNNIGNQLETKSMIIRDKLTGRIIGQQKENLAFGMRNMTQERYIAILNKMVAGPLPLTEIQMKKYGITLQNNNIIIAENTILTEEQIIRLKLYGMTLQTVTAGTEVATMASQRLSMAMMGIGSILMVGSMAFAMIGEKLKIFGDEANVMRISMVMMALTMGFLVMEIILTTASISALSTVLEVGLIKSFVIWGLVFGRRRQVWGRWQSLRLLL